MHTTFVIPAYNTQDYIGSCLSSILSLQGDYDIVVVDDGSTDNTVHATLSHMQNKPISLITTPHKNVTEATKIGIENAQGPIISIVDSDDKVLPNCLSVCTPPFEDPEIGFVWSQFTLSNLNRTGWSLPLPPGKTLFQAMIKKGWWNAAHHKFFRKSTYEKSFGLNSHFDRASDYQLVLLLATTQCKTLHIPIPTYWYRYPRRNSISSQGREIQKQVAREILTWVKSQMQSSDLQHRLKSILNP